MCGIVGIFDTRERRPIDGSLLARMNEAQWHRGPDEGGVHTEPGVGLGHRRLSIIDLSSGHQPLFNEDGSVVVVFNGEIYNYAELMDELTRAGHVFKTRCDTEVIAHGWEEWGEKCVQRFRGMFAFAVWDRNRRTLFLARDRLGVKPLYYAWLPDGHLVFASELKALMAHPQLKREIDPRAVEDYFAYGYIPEPKTIFTSALKLPPAHTLLVRSGETHVEPRAYWDIPFTPVSIGSERAAAEELIARVREAVRIRMVAEVPLGAFLSGGVDSSAVVAMMAGLDDKPVQTCSISFGDPRFNETEYAAQVAARYGTAHHVEQVEADDYGLIDTLARIYDEPYADSSAMPTYRVCELARKRVTVALSGDGGDETLAGYKRYQWQLGEERMRSWLPGALRQPLFGALGAAYPDIPAAPRPLRAKATLQALGRDADEGYFHLISVIKDGARNELFSPGLRKALNGYHALEVMRGHAANAPEDTLSRVQYLDMKTYLPGDILTKVDRASMAHALEVREPLLDHQLMEWASGLPVEYRLRGSEGKYLLKKALEPYLPREILYRPKMGFAVPLGAWFRGPLRERMRATLLGPSLLGTGLFNARCIESLMNEHEQARKDHSAALWSLVMFEAFMRRVLGDGSLEKTA